MNIPIQHHAPNPIVQPPRRTTPTHIESRTAGPNKSRTVVWPALLVPLVCLLLSAPSARAQGTPPGCTGSAIGISLFTSSPDVHIGDTLFYSVSVFNGILGNPTSCDASNIVATLTTPDGVVHPIALRRTYLSHGESDFYTNVVSYVVRSQDVRTDATVRATAQDTATIYQNDTPSTGGANQGVNTEVSLPCILLTVQCLPGIGENGAIAFTGTVTNCGNNTLVGVTVTNFVDGMQFPVTFITNLARGQVASFSGSWIPLDPCAPSTARLEARGVDQFTTFPQTVTSSVNTTCSEVLTPGIRVTQSCPPDPVRPGQLLVFSGSVSNTGNVTLTNIVVVNSQPAANTPVFTLGSLAPGAVATFTGSYLAPTNCSVSGSLTATATSRCGVGVNSTAPGTCPILTTPGIEVTVNCPPNNASVGGTLTYSGTVRNTGDITLNNVAVVGDRPAPGTTVFTVASLAPGASANFSGSLTVPANACSVTTLFSATGRDLCTSLAVTNTTSATCTITTAPAITVTLACPPTAAQTGQSITLSGTVRNSGNVTLNNVAVIHNLASPNTVFTVPNLAPGASANFTASFTSPSDACDVTSTVTASGADACTAALVSNSASATCSLATSPSVSIDLECPAIAAVPGGTLNFSGTVRNIGNITLTNVTVINDRTGAAPIFTAARLAPGESASFSGNYAVPANVCDVTSTSTVRATSLCGAVVSQSKTLTCPVAVAPAISVTTICSTNTVAPGGVITYTGTVSNGGNITLSNVVVVSDRPAPNTTVFSTATLAPGASANFSGTYTAPLTFPLNGCSVTANVTASARDICAATVVTSTASAICTITTTPRITVTLACPVVPAVIGGPITFTGTVSNPGNITLNNVTVVNTQTSPSTVLSVPSLAPGASVPFSFGFTTPADDCSVTTTVTASGNDLCTTASVSNTASATCPLTTTPLLTLTQECPVTPVSPGGTVTYTARVRNAGNITLRNVVVSSGQATLPNPGNPVISTAGLVGHWAMNEASGAVANDSSGLGNHGNIVAAARVAGYSGNALDFNGANSSVSIPDNTGLNITGPLTLAAWVNSRSSAGKQNILARGYTTVPAQNASVYLRINDGRYEIGTWNGLVQPTASAEIPAGDIGKFVHVAGVFSGTTWTIYRQGVALNTVAGIAPVSVNAPWAIGARDGGTDRFFNGILDEVRLYNRALSADEILNLAGGGSIPTTPSTPVFTTATLAPGATADFTVSYPAPSNGVCTVTSVLTANAADICTGVLVAASTTNTCTLVTQPAIEVTQLCPATPVLPGSILQYSGTVRNTGNITLNNVTVVNDRSGTTPIFTVASLAPGASASFTGSYVTLTNCCVDSSTVKASGIDICTGASVSDAFTKTCTLLTQPRIVVTKVCAPGLLEPGSLLRFSGTVSNAGNITLVNVTLVNNQPNAGSPVLGPIVLAPGESVPYSGSYVVAVDFCGTDTVTARGLDACTDVQVEHSATTTCPILTTPRIALTQDCPPQPTPRGGIHTFTGTVSNPGNVTLTNVFVINNQPAPNTAVIGPITLAPGATVNFSGSYTAPSACCDILNTLTARGQDRCAGTTVSATASALCPLLSTPLLQITRVCPTTPVPVGGLFVFRGTVRNSGDVYLTNVFVHSGAPAALLSWTAGTTESGIALSGISSQSREARLQAIKAAWLPCQGPNPAQSSISLAGNNTAILGPIDLAPGESQEFTGSYLVTAGSNPSDDIVTATAMDTCQARTVTARANCAGPVNQTAPAIVGAMVLNGDRVRVSWTSTPGVTYQVQSQANPQEPWVNLPGTVTATSTTASKDDARGTHRQRFYRIMIVQE